MSFFTSYMNPDSSENSPPQPPDSKSRQVSERKRVHPPRPQWQPWQGVVPQNIRYACFAWQFIKYSFIFYLCKRQRNVLNERRHVPRALLGRMPPEIFERARAYHISLNNLRMVSCIHGTIFEVWLVLYAGFTTLWFTSGPVMDWIEFWPDEWDRETGESIVFMILTVIHFSTAELPLILWKTFFIEEKFGFNKMTIRDFLLDWAKWLIFECTYMSLYGVVLLWIVYTTGRFFFIWLWIFTCVGLIITLTIYPNYIAPIFDTYTPLREGRLKMRLRKLASFLNFPLDDIVVLHQSWRSEHRKVYFYGLLGSKKIVIYDTVLRGYPEADTDLQAEQRIRRHVAVPKEGENSTTMEQFVPSRILRQAYIDNVAASISPASSNEINEVDGMGSNLSRNSMYETGFTEHEIEALVARMMGHWVLGHSFKELVFPIINLFLFFLIFSLLYENSSLFQAFEVPRGMDKPILLGLKLLYLDVMDIYNILVGYLMKHLDRKRKYEADAFATKLGYGEDLINAYIQREKENLDYPYFDSWYWNFHFTEPSILHSIAAIEMEIEEMNRKND